MERATAIKKLGKILGKHFGYRVDPKAPDQDARDEALEILRKARPEREALRAAKEARCKALLQADEEYQRLKADYAEASKHYDRLLATTSHYRVTVGTTSEMFFHVKAQGDSWEDVISKLNAKEKA